MELGERFVNIVKEVLGTCRQLKEKKIIYSFVNNLFMYICVYKCTHTLYK